MTRSVLVLVGAEYGERGSGFLGACPMIIEGQPTPWHGAMIVWQAGDGVINIGRGVVAFGLSVMVSLTEIVEVAISYTTFAVLVTNPEQFMPYWASLSTELSPVRNGAR